MLNVIGISLSFVGTLATLIVILSTKTKNPTTWDALERSLMSKVEEYWLASVGLILLTVGYLIQIAVALSDI